MPQLPNAERAIVPDRKITAYLLSPTHQYGAPKAAFFARFGFQLSAWEALRDALSSHALAYDVDRSYVTKYGTIYEVVGPIETPDGRNPTILVAWIIWPGEDTPRLVTAVPS